MGDNIGNEASNMTGPRGSRSCLGRDPRMVEMRNQCQCENTHLNFPNYNQASGGNTARQYNEATAAKCKHHMILTTQCK